MRGGLASWQAQTEETETYPGRPTPLQLDTHLLSAICSVSLERRRCSAARRPSMSFIVPPPFPHPTRRHPGRWIQKIPMVPRRHKQPHYRRRRGEYSYTAMRAVLIAHMAERTEVSKRSQAFVVTSHKPVRARHKSHVHVAASPRDEFKQMEQMRRASGVTPTPRCGCAPV